MADTSKPWEEFASQQPVTGGEKPWEEFGGETKEEGRGLIGHARDLGLSVAKGVIGVPEAAVGLADIPTEGRVGKFLENQDGMLGFRPREAKDFLSDLHTDQYKQQQQDFQDADGVVDKTLHAVQNPSMVVNTVAESLPSMLAGARSVVAFGRWLQRWHLWQPARLAKGRLWLVSKQSRSAKKLMTACSLRRSRELRWPLVCWEVCFPLPAVAWPRNWVSVMRIPSSLVVPTQDNWSASWRPCRRRAFRGR